MADSSFDSFGDFGDFQSAGSDSFGDDGSLTPTGVDSWSFTSASSTGSYDEPERRPGEASRDSDERTERDN